MTQVIITIETSNPSRLVALLEKKNVQISNSEEHYSVTKIEIEL